MKVNVKKCATATYLMNSDRHHRSLGENLKLNGSSIPNVSLAKSLKYRVSTKRVGIERLRPFQNKGLEGLFDPRENNQVGIQ
jgi:hypothetical protein